jgi:sterol desaturase/sphingolipid hydroxylase (fatty acid hydroxylase superfamily)
MIDFNKYHQTMFNVFLNQILSIPFLIIPISLIYYIGNDMSLTIPSYWILSKHIVLSLLIFDIIFFVSHYFSHCGYLYKYFHKIHHEWPSPVAVAAHYNHFIEHLFLNIFAPAISIIIIGANYFTMCLWFIIATIAVTFTHSGYSFAGATRHDYHHHYYKAEYGVFISDYLFGTNI